MAQRRSEEEQKAATEADEQSIATEKPLTAELRSDAERSPARSPLREDVRQIVLERILSGELPPGSRITESRLAAELGVSRTPLREALFNLESEGFVRSDLARGFSVAPLSVREVRESYPILQTLEVLALRSIGQLAATSAPELRQINEKLAAVAGDSAGGQLVDHEWHEALLAACPNRRLLDLIARLKETVSRYERLYMRDESLARASVAQHLRVIEALEANDLSGAVRELEENWRFALETLLVRLGEP
ncbi:MAG TPA: GntR family transcriptional regulator [Gemmatimonadaceae bacterium]|jgi:DNA-binding GntR family transcriptional regulator|nr:GntR family transcriptional regulator [Gemmatimonadaceae bacterium]